MSFLSAMLLAALTFIQVECKWTSPTKLSDNTTLTDLGGHIIKIGKSPGAYTSTIDVPIGTNKPGDIISRVMEITGPGPTYVSVVAYRTVTVGTTSTKIEGQPSNEVVVPDLVGKPLAPASVGLGLK